MLRLQTVTEGKSTESLCWSVVATSTGPLRYSLTCSVRCQWSCSAAMCSVATSCWMSLRVSATRNTNTVSQAVMRNLSTETEM